MKPQPKPLILLAEDEPNIAFSLSYVFERAGFDVHVTADGSQVEGKARAMLPEVIVLDLMLPNKSGFDILRDLKTHKGSAHIPILVLSAKGQQTDLKRANDAGADVYMTKPFSNAEVVKAVRALVSKSG